MKTTIRINALVMTLALTSAGLAGNAFAQPTANPACAGKTDVASETFQTCLLVAVDSYYAGYKNRDLSSALIANGVTFNGPLVQAAGLADLLAKSVPAYQLYQSIDNMRIFTNGNQVVALYDFVTVVPGVTLHISEHLTIVDGLITKIDVIYDPRALLAAMSESPKSGI